MEFSIFSLNKELEFTLEMNRFQFKQSNIFHHMALMPSVASHINSLIQLNKEIGNHRSQHPNKRNSNFMVLNFLSWKKSLNLFPAKKKQVIHDCTQTSFLRSLGRRVASTDMLSCHCRNGSSGLSKQLRRS